MNFFLNQDIIEFSSVKEQPVEKFERGEKMCLIALVSPPRDPFPPLLSAIPRDGLHGIVFAHSSLHISWWLYLVNRLTQVGFGKF